MKALVQPGGFSFETEPDRTLLQSADAAGVELPSSCRNGTCRTCMCRLESGSVRYLVEWPGLAPDEKKDYVLPCVAVPQSDVVLDNPLARRS